ncbi:MAG: binding-protein-dependent transport system inner rane component, partial [Paenibacillus sp.]|nr:binding-protein-dependent transport system inner rane component [Paenibacillus sp.]
EVELMKELSNQTVKSAQIFLGALPIIAVYPFLQKFFVKGIVLGSVKG